LTAHPEDGAKISKIILNNIRKKRESRTGLTLRYPRPKNIKVGIATIIVIVSVWLTQGKPSNRKSNSVGNPTTRSNNKLERTPLTLLPLDLRVGISEREMDRSFI